MRSLIDFLNTARLHGLNIEHPICNGQVQRCSTADKPNKKNGWYIVFLEPFRAVFGNHRTNEKFQYPERASSSAISMLESTYKKIKQEQVARAQQRTELQSQVALKAQYTFESSKPALNHPYLKEKGLSAMENVHLGFVQLLIPLWNLEVEHISDINIHNLQLISPNGDKRFMKGGKVKGCAFILEPKNETNQVYICEGVATAATIHQITGGRCLAAMNASNLILVTQLAKKHWPESLITVCGDDDCLTEQRTGINPGRESAIKAANKINGLVSLPPFSQYERMAGLTDWNDWYIKSQGARYA